MALKGKLGMFARFEVDVVRLHFNLGVVFVMLFNHIDESPPVVAIYDTF